MKKTKFRVYIEQVNQTYFDVEAKNQEEAKLKAGKEWKQENYPRILSVEETN